MTTEKLTFEQELLRLRSTLPQRSSPEQKNNPKKAIEDYIAKLNLDALLIEFSQYDLKKLQDTKSWVLEIQQYYSKISSRKESVYQKLIQLCEKIDHSQRENFTKQIPAHLDKLLSTFGQFLDTKYRLIFAVQSQSASSRLAASNAATRDPEKFQRFVDAKKEKLAESETVCQELINNLNFLKEIKEHGIYTDQYLEQQKHESTRDYVRRLEQFQKSIDDFQASQNYLKINETLEKFKAIQEFYLKNKQSDDDLTIFNKAKELIDELQKFKSFIDNAAQTINDKTEAAIDTSVKKETEFKPNSIIVYNWFEKPSDSFTSKHGIEVGGHAAIRVCGKDASEDYYFSLVPSGNIVESATLIQTATSTATRTPKPHTYKGQLSTLENEARAFHSGEVYCEKQEVVIDCETLPGLNIQNALDWAKKKHELATRSQVGNSDKNEIVWNFQKNNCADICKEALEAAGADSIVRLKKNWANISTPRQILSYANGVLSQLTKNKLDNDLKENKKTKEMTTAAGLSNFRIPIQNIINLTQDPDIVNNLSEMNDICADLEKSISNKKHEDTLFNINKLNQAYLKFETGLPQDKQVEHSQTLEIIQSIMSSISACYSIQCSKASKLAADATVLKLQASTKAVLGNLKTKYNIPDNFLKLMYNEKRGVNDPEIKDNYSDADVIFESFHWTPKTVEAYNSNNVEERKKDAKKETIDGSETDEESKSSSESESSNLEHERTHIRQFFNEQSITLSDQNELNYCASVKKIIGILSSVHTVLYNHAVYSKADLFNQAYHIKSAITRFLNDCKNETDDDIKNLYRDCISNLRKAYGDFNKALYFENKMLETLPHTLPQLLSEINGNKADISDLEDFVKNQFEINKKLLNSPRPFAFFAAEFDQNQTKNDIKNILENSKTDEFDKSREINRIIEQHEPKWWEFWRWFSSEQEKYDILKFNAKLVRVLQAFFNGKIDEACTIANIRDLAYHHPNKEQRKLFFDIANNISETFKHLATTLELGQTTEGNTVCELKSELISKITATYGKIGQILKKSDPYQAERPQNSKSESKVCNDKYSIHPSLTSSFNLYSEKHKNNIDMKKTIDAEIEMTEFVLFGPKY